MNLGHRVGIASKKYLPKHAEMVCLKPERGPRLGAHEPSVNLSTDLSITTEQTTPKLKPIHRRRHVEWTPYTLSDYRKLNSQSVSKSGGLGAFNIGTDEWNTTKTRYEKRMLYSKRVNYNNIFGNKNKSFTHYDLKKTRRKMLAPRKLLPIT
jgi:hypothetical protein